MSSVFVTPLLYLRERPRASSVWLNVGAPHRAFTLNYIHQNIYSRNIGISAADAAIVVIKTLLRCRKFLLVRSRIHSSTSYISTSAGKSLTRNPQATFLLQHDPHGFNQERFTSTSLLRELQHTFPATSKQKENRKTLTDADTMHGQNIKRW